MSQTRAKDLLDAKDYIKLLKANVSEIRESDFNLVQVEKIIENYRDLLVDIAERTSRMNEAPLKNGTLQCFDITPRTATLFAERVAGAFRFCVDKSRFYTTGKRLAPATAAVVKVIAAQKRKNTPVMKAQSPKGTAAKFVRSQSSKVADSPAKPRAEALPLEDKCKTPEKAKVASRSPQTPRKARVLDKSPTWSLPASPAVSETRGVPACPRKPRASQLQPGSVRLQGRSQPHL